MFDISNVDPKLVDFLYYCLGFLYLLLLAGIGYVMMRYLHGGPIFEDITKHRTEDEL